MPHVVLKIWTGKTEQQKEKLAAEVTAALMGTFYGEDSISVSIEEVDPAEWTEKVYNPEILNGPGKLYKKPGYKPA